MFIKKRGRRPYKYLQGSLGQGKLRKEGPGGDLRKSWTLRTRRDLFLNHMSVVPIFKIKLEQKEAVPCPGLLLPLQTPS